MVESPKKNESTDDCNFLHKGVTLCTDKQPSSAQGSVYFINYGHDTEVILKSVSTLKTLFS